MVTLRWFQAFFGKGGSRIGQIFRLDAYLRTDTVIEIGADVFSIGEPFMMGVDELAKQFGGRTCFECSPDNRTILSKANKDQIEDAVKKLVSGFSSPKGGLILVAAPDNFDCVSEEAKQMAIEAVNKAKNGQL